MRKPYIFKLSIVLIIVVAIIGFLVAKNNNKDVNNKSETVKPKSYEIILFDSKLDKYLKDELENTRYDYQIIFFSSERLYGVIIDPPNGGTNILGNTVGIFSYDVISDKFDTLFHEFNENISSYYETERHVYYIETFIDESDEDYFHWNFVKTDKKFGNKVILESGKYYLMTGTPLFIIDSITQKAYLFKLNDNVKADGTLISQVYECFELRNDELKKIISGSYDIGNKSEYIVNTWSVIVRDNMLYYSVKDSKNNDIVYKYNIVNNNKEIIYKNNSKDYYLFSYQIFGDNIAVARLNSDENSLFEVYDNKKKVYGKNIIGVSIIFAASHDKILIATNLGYQIYNSKFNSLFDVVNTKDIPSIVMRDYSENHVFFNSSFESKIGKIKENY